jgi:hypothetical protein
MSMAAGRKRSNAAMPLLLACMVAAAPAAAQGPSMRDMFKGIPTDRCKDIGGPPPSDVNGPHIDSIDVKEGKPGTIVTLKGTGFDPGGGEEIRFLLKGKDTVVVAERPSTTEIRARVPDMGVRGKAERGWVFLVRKVDRKEYWGRAASFLFLPADAPSGFPGPAPPEKSPPK